MLSREAEQHQPDSVAAAVVVYETLGSAAGSQMTIAAPITGRHGHRDGHAALPGIDRATVQPFNPLARRVADND
jgi:hypothetical protein